MNTEREQFLRKWAGHPSHIEELWNEIDGLRAQLAAAAELLDLVNAEVG